MPLPVTTKRLIWATNLGRAHWGQGFAPEAARACLEWGLAERPERVVAIVDPANTRSARVLDKIGMIRNGTWHGFDHEWNLYIAAHAR